MGVRAFVAGSLAAALACGLLAAPVPSASASVTTPSGRTFLVLAHRGDGADAPENSVEAYRAAGLAGYDGVETDIQFSSDHVAVMSHSDVLKPGQAAGSDCTLPDKSGSVKIHQTTWAVLQTVRCKDLTGAYTVPLATFADLAGVLAEFPNLQLTLDLKKYSGASATAQRDYAKRAAELIIANGLVSRTRILTYNWDAMLPTIRKYLPKTYVLAYDHSAFSYARVRLAAKLKASGYGIEARYTSVNLAAFITAKKLDVVPWNLSGAPDATQAAAFSIVYGPKSYWFLTDDPAAEKQALETGTERLDWAPADVPTTLTAPVSVDTATYQAGRNRYPRVLGTAVPAAQRAGLKTVTVSLTTTKGPKKNYAYLAAKGSDASSRVKVKLPKGSGTVVANVPVGDDGRLRLRTSKKTKLVVQVIGYTRVVFN